MVRRVVLSTSFFLIALHVGGAGCRRLGGRPAAGADAAAGRVEALAAIEQLHARDMRAVLAGDTATLMSLWTDDIVAIAPGRPVTVGRTRNAEALRRDMATSRGAAPIEYVLAFDAVEVYGDLAVEWGTYRGRARLAGAEVAYHGKVMRVLRRERDGAWRVARTMFTQEQPGHSSGSCR